MNSMCIVPSAVGQCVLLLVSAGCAGPPPPSTTLRPLPISAFDGLYRGEVQVTGVAAAADRSWCETQTVMELPVTSNQFTLSVPHPNVPGSPTVVFAASIAPDGSFRTMSESGGAMLMGRVSGAHLQG